MDIHGILAILFFVILTAYSVACAVKPEIHWKLFERWKSYRADEPSDIFLLLTRIGSIVAAVIGAAMIVFVIYTAVQPDPEPGEFNPDDIVVKTYDQFGNDIVTE